MIQSKHDLHAIAVRVNNENMEHIYKILNSAACEGLFEQNIYIEKDLELFVREKVEVDKVLCKVKAIKQVLEDKGLRVYELKQNKCFKGDREYYTVVEYLTVSWY